MTITLYEAPGCSRCNWTIRELDAPIEVRTLTRMTDVKAAWADQLRALDLELQAALEEDGRILLEPTAICTYLADKYPSRGLIAKAGSWQRAVHNEWCSLARGLEQLLLSSATVGDRTIERKSAGMSSVAVAAITEHNAIEFRKLAQRLERSLAHSAYLVSSSFSITDIIVSHALNWADLNRAIDDFHHCLEYLDRIKQRPTCTLTGRKRT